MEQWVAKKEKQIEDETREKQNERLREVFNAKFDQSIRSVRDRDMMELLRTELLKMQGIRQAED